ncbi:MAG: hypothetical protein H0X43_13965 [Nitrosospira sp.]|nr:hypothetical protein [Nitrosospira sp.]
MAIVKFYTEGDMSNTSLLIGDVSSASPTEITISAGSVTGTWTGQFTYSDTDLAGGTVTGYRQYENSILQFEISGINLPALTIAGYYENDDGLGLYQYALSGNDTINGSWGADVLAGFEGNDTINGYFGNDVIVGGGGNDVIDGGEGFDTAVFDANMQDINFSVKDGVITATDKTGTEGQDRIVNIQQLAFNGDQLVTLPNALQYIASYGDLVSAFKGDADAGMTHFLNQGIHEGRTASFDALEYIASYGDLIEAFGTDTDAATAHYVQTGFAEGRAVTFDALQYIASYGDLIEAYGTDTDAATAHYIQHGIAEGRTPTFDAMQYTASYEDLIELYGTDTDAATTHYIQTGFADHRIPSFNALQYTASYGDLIEAFGTDTDAATAHYVQHGFAEGRSVTFDAPFYLAKYPDLRVAFNIDESLAANHYITHGFNEERVINANGDDILTGSNWGGLLDGGNGNDILIGGSGDDILIGGIGTDFLHGGSGDDILIGGDGTDFLNGGSGSNILTGGGGADTFHFDTALTSDITSITDFNLIDDQILLDSRVFTGLTLGNLSGDEFTTGTSATGSNSQIIFDSENNALLYDEDGIGGNDAVHFATLVGLNENVTASDFVVA